MAAQAQPAMPVSTIPPVPWSQDPLFIRASDTRTNPAGPTAYVHPPRARTSNPQDVTAFHPGQATWGPNNIPAILDRILPTQSFVDAETLARRRPQLICARQLRDGQGNPMFERNPEDPDEPIPLLDYPILPSRISIDVEPWRAEAWMRLDPRIHRRDILSRMIGQGRPKSNAFNMKISRWRDRNMMPSWRQGAQNNDVSKRTQYLQSYSAAEVNANSRLGRAFPRFERPMAAPRGNGAGNTTSMPGNNHQQLAPGAAGGHSTSTSVPQTTSNNLGPSNVGTSGQGRGLMNNTANMGQNGSAFPPSSTARAPRAIRDRQANLQNLGSLERSPQSNRGRRGNMTSGTKRRAPPDQEMEMANTRRRAAGAVNRYNGFDYRPSQPREDIGMERRPERTHRFGAMPVERRAPVAGVGEGNWDLGRTGPTERHHHQGPGYAMRGNSAGAFRQTPHPTQANVVAATEHGAYYVPSPEPGFLRLRRPYDGYQDERHGAGAGGQGMMLPRDSPGPGWQGMDATRGFNPHDLDSSATEHLGQARFEWFNPASTRRLFQAPHGFGTTPPEPRPVQHDYTEPRGVHRQASRQGNRSSIHESFDATRNWHRPQGIVPPATRPFAELDMADNFVTMPQEIADTAGRAPAMANTNIGREGQSAPGIVPPPFRPFAELDMADNFVKMPQEIADTAGQAPAMANTNVGREGQSAPGLPDPTTGSGGRSGTRVSRLSRPYRDCEYLEETVTYTNDPHAIDWGRTTTTRRLDRVRDAGTINEMNRLVERAPGLSHGDIRSIKLKGVLKVEVTVETMERDYRGQRVREDLIVTQDIEGENNNARVRVEEELPPAAHFFPELF